MTVSDEHRTSKRAPYAVTDPSRIPSRRYYDPDFYAMECELLWPRVWQMACRLEEIPNPGDYVVYDNLDQSVIILRAPDGSIRAYHNACRHRGVRLVDDRGSLPGGFVCPFHAWSYDLEGRHTYMLAPEIFEPRNVVPDDIALRKCRVELWGGCAFVNFDDNAPPLRDSIEPFASMHDAHHVEKMRTEWCYSVRLPANWKLAMEAFMEGYHVLGTHPELLPPGLTASKATYLPVAGTTFREPPEGPVDSKMFIDMTIKSFKILSEGMGGSMTHEKDLWIMESLRDLELPEDPGLAFAQFSEKLNDAVMEWNRRAGMDIADLNKLAEQGLAFPAANPVNYCFPHYFLLPMFGNAAFYRIRPLGPEECLFEIGSLTLFPEGEEPPPPKTPEPWEWDDPRWPTIPGQDFSNLPKQQRGLHTKGFEYMRLSARIEGLISNYQRLIDGYLAGLDYEELLRAAQQHVNGMIEHPSEDMGF